MLKIYVPSREVTYYDKDDNGKQVIKFKTLNPNGCTLTLEHSLVSLRKWEEKYHKPFIESSKVIEGKQTGLTADELRYYVKCMTITQNVDDSVYYILTQDNYQKIQEYMKDPMSAMTVQDNRSEKSKQNKQTVSKKITTNETIYCMMFSCGIPLECEKRNLNWLFNILLQMSNNNNPEKMSKQETMDYYKRISERNRAKFKSKG